MTNEELVERIQEGEEALLPTLWEQVYKFAYLMAAKRARASEGLGIVTVEDLRQCGYIALVDAVKSYPAQGDVKFITVYTNHLRNAFRSAIGFQTNAALKAMSLDTPIGGEDFTLGDTIQDPTDDYQTVDERIHQEQLHKALEVALEVLPEVQCDTLRHRYYRDHTLKETAEAMGVMQETARQRECKAIRGIRKNPAVMDSLKDFIETNTPYYLRVGVSRFQSTHSSAVEEIVLLRERMQESRK